MSTHFRPHPPPPTPSSPLRPSTAHSTIRAITPSPPIALPRPKSAHALTSPNLATARYVVKAENGESTSTPSPGLIRGGVKFDMSPSVKPWPKSPRRRSHSTPDRIEKYTATLAQSDMQPKKHLEGNADVGNGNHEEQNPPDTPTPMSREQKRDAYVPLSAQPSILAPVRNPIVITGPKSKESNKHASITAFSTLSVASKHSIFSTPGRDELERKKVVVEADEGPFGRVKSVSDLDEARKKVSMRERRGGKDALNLCQCAVM